MSRALSTLSNEARLSAGEAYTQYHQVIADAAEGFARQYAADPEECMGDAAFAFLEAWGCWDPELGSLEKRITNLIWRRLYTWQYRNKNVGCRRPASGKIVSLDSARDDKAPISRLVAAAQAPEFDRDYVLGGLGSDARVVAETCLALPAELVDNLADGAKSVLAAVKDLLGSVGWTRNRINAACREAAELL